MRNSVKKWGVGIAVFAAIVTTAVLLPQDKVTDFHEKYEGTDLTSDIKGMERAGTYIRYITGHDSSVRPQENVNIELFDYTSAKDVERYTSYEGVDEALYTGVDSTVTWQINVPQSGYYNLYTEYLIPESRGVVAERIVYINGEIPFESARNITFSRIWTDGGEVKVDNQGNEIRPTQKEVFAWQKAYFRDDRGYEAEPYLFYFEKGINELTLEAENEPMILKSLELKSVQDMDDYQAYLEKQPGVNMTETGTSYQQIVQGEDSTLRSESSLYAKYDRSSPTTQPNSVTNTVLNYVGGEAWRSAGQWIEWNFEVPEDGYYNLMIKARQNYARGSISSRSVYIDGEIPFSEMKEISFEYENDWNCMTLTDEEGTPYQFYLKEGTHTLRLEATLGGVGSILEELEDSIYRLNQIYRKLLIYTGVQPDKYRDYNIQQVYPEVIEAMDLESKRLYKIVDEMVAYSGQKADNIATAQTVAQ